MIASTKSNIIKLQNSVVYLAAILITLRLGFVVYLLYIISLPLLFKIKKINKQVSIFSVVVIVYYLFKVLAGEIPIDALEQFKYYFGFLVFLMLFSSVKLRLNNDLYFLFVVLSLSIIAEYFIINYNLLPMKYWVNVTNVDGELLHIQTFGAMRPYGIGKNATITATIVIVLFVHLMFETQNRYFQSSYLKKAFLIALYFYVIFVLQSGLGYFISLIVIYWLIPEDSKYKILKIYATLLFFLAVFYIFYYIQQVIGDEFARFSISYVLYLIDYKTEQILVGLLPENFSFINFAFGALGQRSFTNDTGWIPFFYAVGVMGLFLYVYIVMVNINKYNAKSLMLLILAAWHYPAIFSIPGQILFAYLLTRQCEVSISEYKFTNTF